MTSTHKARHPFVRNHYLPNWIHRLCNALVVALVVSVLLVYLLPYRAAVMAGAVLFVVVLCINPRKLSFVEGVAGEDGYLDLDER